MQVRTAQRGRMATAVAAALMHFAAQAQQADTAASPAAEAQAVAATETSAPAAAAPSDGLKLERVVVTGTARGQSKMKTSVSVSTMDDDAIARAVPTSAAELLRSIPGLRSESSGGEGNANITVRGVPISAGGSRYVQMQEDGLPVLQFGDFNFITPDAYVKIDSTLSHVEAVRGGSASTLASNSPGGIINFISKTGDSKGGSIGITRGLDYDQLRYDFSYGAPLTDKTRFFIGGHYRTGEGIRPNGMSMENGGQIKGNLTHEFDRGYLRLSFKHVDDQTPTALPVPVSVTNGRVSEIAGIDPRTASFYSPYWGQDVTLTKGNGKASTNVNDGFTVKSDTFGVGLSLDLGQGVALTENFRHSRNTGRFIGIFPSDNGSVGSYTVATGPQAGQAYNGRAFKAVVFNTSIDDAGSTFNDVKLSKTWAIDGGKLTGTAGLYTSLQNLGLTWSFNEYLLQAKTDSPALLKTASSTPGYIGPAWGGCCMRAVDMEYKLVSPYANVGWEKGALNVDASVRRDSQRATGTGNIATDGLRYEPSTQQLINYALAHTSYSIGGNYQLQRNLALFARISEGVAFNADRILFGTPLDGSAPVNINTVKQIEGGVKWRQGGASAFVTVFQAKTAESNYEATTQISTSNRYNAKGGELELAYNTGDFRINGGLTYTDAEITGAARGQEYLIGNTPRRQAKVVYQLAPSYTIGDATVSLTVIGTGKSWADDKNTITMPAYRVVNASVQYQMTPQATFTLSANNLFNTLGYTEVEGSGHAARAISGRSIKAGLQYAF